MNWTLEDFYIGDKVAVEFNRFSYDHNKLERLTKGIAKGNFRFYWFDNDGNIRMNMDTTMPSAPLSYFISLLNAQEAAAKEEYIYEPFSEEDAMLVGTIVTYDELIVDFARKGKNGVCIVNEHGELFIVKESDLRIRRPIETKEVECYVYASGLISSQKITRIHGDITETFTHTIKIPKK